MAGSSTSSPKTRVFGGRFKPVGLIIMTILGCLCIRKAIYRSYGGEALGSRPRVDGVSETIQNDFIGYQGVPWGSGLPAEQSPPLQSSFVESSSDPDTFPILAHIFGVQDKIVDSGTMFQHAVLDGQSVPQQFQSIRVDECEHIYYRGGFAMAYCPLRPASYDATLAELQAKFSSPQMSTSSWSEADRTTTLSVFMFKRGSTNTRVYLLKSVEVDSGTGLQITSAYLLYIPNQYYFSIREAISSLKDENDAAAEARAQRSAKPDVDKVQ